MAAHNPPAINPLQIPPRRARAQPRLGVPYRGRPVPPPHPPHPRPGPHNPRPAPQSVPPAAPDGNPGGSIDLSWFKVVVMRCTAGLHEGAASVTLDRWQGTWQVLPDNFVESALQASSRLPIQHLILRRHKLVSLPGNLASASTLLPHSLTTLDLSYNSFVSLPSVVCQLINLHELYLNDNKLSHLPDELPNLEHLQDLRLQHNHLKSIPVCVCAVKSLRFLNMENNEIDTIPPEVSQLTKLRQLYLKVNRIAFLPDGFCQLSSLEELHLADNALTSLPDRLEGLASLKQLHLANNKLHFLPLSIINLHSLQGLTLSGNELKFPPLSACRNGVKSLREYMLEKYKSSSKVWASPDGAAEVSENLYYFNSDSDDSGNDTPYEDIDGKT